MRIGIDARFYGTLGKGLGRYTQQLIVHLEEVDSRNTYFIFLRPENYDAYVPGRSNFHKVLADIPWYSWKEQIFLPWLLLRYRCDLVHFTHFNVPFLYRKPFVLTIHDLILFHFPTIRSTTRSRMGYGIKYLAYRIILRSGIHRARRIITVSRHTREDLVKNFCLKKEKIAVTYQAATDLSQQDNGKTGQCDIPTIGIKYGILGRYFLYVGNAYPHKNLERLLDAFQQFHRTNIQLVLVGKQDYFYDRLRRFADERGMRDILFTGEVTDSDLVCLYRGAIAYVFPSLYEGFGLPPFEAMAQGTPVVASDRAALPEVLGSSALYCNPEDVEDIAEKLRMIMDDTGLRTRAIEEGYRQVKKFSWKQLAERTRRVYESCEK